MCRIIGPGFYIFVAFAIVCFWPLLLLQEFLALWSIIILVIVNIGLLVFTFIFCSEEELSFYHGLAMIIMPIQSGCANITIIYALPLLCVLYYYALFLSVIGIFKGKKFTLFHWQKLVLWFFGKYKI